MQGEKSKKKRPSAVIVLEKPGKNLRTGQALDAVRFLPSLQVHTDPHADTPSRTHCPLQLGSLHAYSY